ncbi:hypothetical protein [Kordia sp.]|uniref:hypothetical protein n=1 Tax=Kordia sp. TaxID=1965332 RepID=UPI003D2BAF06
MRKLLKILMYAWEKRRKKRKELKELLNQAGLKLVKAKNTSITLACIIPISDKQGKYKIVDEADNSIVYNTGLTEDEAAEQMARYMNDATERYPKLSGDEALNKYMDNVGKLNTSRNKIKLKYPEKLGTIPKNGGVTKLELIDDSGTVIGKIIRSNKNRKIEYRLFYKNKKINIYSEVSLANKQFGKTYKLPIKDGEDLLYVDFAIPKSITDELSGLGKIMLDDALAFFKKNKKFGNVDGTIDLYIKDSRLYKNYGGESILLKQFWKAMKQNGGDIEKSAFSTFGGKWAKENGFTKVVVENVKQQITPDEVIIKFLKESQ